jgi:hypothetical protein
MDRSSFEKLHKLITELVLKPNEAANEQAGPLTPEEKELLKSVQLDIDRFAAGNAAPEDAEIWSMGLLIKNSASTSSANKEWTLGFFSIPMIRHSGTSSGEEWTLTFASIPMVRHRSR